MSSELAIVDAIGRVKFMLLGVLAAAVTVKSTLPETVTIFVAGQRDHIQLRKVIALTFAPLEPLGV